VYQQRMCNGIEMGWWLGSFTSARHPEAKVVAHLPPSSPLTSTHSYTDMYLHVYQLPDSHSYLNSTGRSTVCPS
jgi:hypothetical protein